MDRWEVCITPNDEALLSRWGTFILVIIFVPQRFFFSSLFDWEFLGTIPLDHHYWTIDPQSWSSKRKQKKHSLESGGCPVPRFLFRFLSRLFTRDSENKCIQCIQGLERSGNRSRLESGSGENVELAERSARRTLRSLNLCMIPNSALSRHLENAGQTHSRYCFSLEFFEKFIKRDVRISPSKPLFLRRQTVRLI